MQRRTILLATSGLLSAPAVLKAQQAASWPNGPVRIVNPFAPGVLQDFRCPSVSG